MHSALSADLRGDVPTNPSPGAQVTPSRRELRERQAAFEMAGVARCPRCRAPLVARMGCHGPAFRCACAESIVSTHDD